MPILYLLPEIYAMLHEFRPEGNSFETVCDGLLFTVQPLRASGGGVAYQCFRVVHGGENAIIYKCLNGGGISWAGLKEVSGAVTLGACIEKTSGISPDPFPNPFSLPSRELEESLITVTTFLIDSMRVDKATFPVNGPPVSHYRLHIEEGWQPVIGRTLCVKTQASLWFPVTLMSHYHLENMSEMVQEYEDGTYQYYRDMNDSLAMMLSRLSGGGHPPSD